ncbi:MAG: LAGLIDADG family homing endonuclease [Candidatus Nanoarchaeia archaeon]|nr:LAGLIDADG family homing endonuclease [Candidatus Nanoarchaeia archaeon]MDD5587487.1 LAGLIDADG family homing endonuclease [Candidatus Nanoarchaeia archaeon]
MDINKISKKDMGYIIGLFLGDGYKNYNKNDRHYRVEFYLNSLKDLDILKRMNLILKKMELTPFTLKDKRCNSIKIYVNSKEFFNFIENEVNMLKKLKLNKDYKMGLISGFIDAEGYVGHGDIVLTQGDKQTLLFFQKICENYDLKNRIYWSKSYGMGKGVWRLRVSTTFKYLSHNSCKVNRIYPNNISL